MDTLTSTPAGERRRERRSGAMRVVMDPLYNTIRWIAGHVRGFYAAVGVFLVAGLALSALAAALFGVMAWWMGAGATQGFDEDIVSWMRSHRGPVLDTLAIVGAALGSGTATWIVLGVGTVVFWFTRHHYSAALLWVSLAGGRILSAELKEAFGRPRPRPEEWTLEVFGNPIGFPSSPSFPSGHAVTSMVIFGTLAYLVVRLEPTVRLRRLTLAAAAALILLIGLSRVYLGVHYPSDVLGGYLAGFVWATAAAFAIEAVRYFAARKPEVVREERDLEKGLRPIREAVGGEGA